MKQLNTALIVLLLFVVSVNLQAQPKPYKATTVQIAALKHQADEMCTALVKQNYQKIAYYTAPQIMKAVGGKEKMVESIKQSMVKIQSHGVAFVSLATGDIKDIYRSKGDLYSIVPDVMQFSANGTVITRGAYLLAVSYNNGARWYFTDTAAFKLQDVKKKFPTYPDGLVIPEAGNGPGM